MPESLEQLRAKARAHQTELTAAQRATVSQLAQRWQIAPSTVRLIPFDELPFMELGQGARFRRRRYRWEDVEVYEQRRLDAARPRRRTA